MEQGLMEQPRLRQLMVMATATHTPTRMAMGSVIRTTEASGCLSVRDMGSMGAIGDFAADCW